MRVLLDHGTPAPLRPLLVNNQIQTAFECGWHTLTNGELLAAAERSGFEILTTTDKNLPYLQNTSGGSIAIIASRPTGAFGRRRADHLTIRYRFELSRIL